MGFDWVPPDLVFALMSSALMAAQILPARAAAAGFSNTGVLTVMALFVVAEGVSQTGALDAAFTLALGRAPSAAVAQARLMLPVLVARSGWGE
jgi:di/tricarboxylate transporter